MSVRGTTFEPFKITFSPLILVVIKISQNLLSLFTEIADKFVSKLDVIEERGNGLKHLAAYVADYLAEKAENDSDKEAAEKAIKILGVS